MAISHWLYSSTCPTAWPPLCVIRFVTLLKLRSCLRAVGLIRLYSCSRSGTYGCRKKLPLPFCVHAVRILYMCISIYTYIHIHVSISLSLSIYIYIYIYTCIHVYMYTCIHVYMYLSLSLYIYIYTNTVNTVLQGEPLRHGGVEISGLHRTSLSAICCFRSLSLSGMSTCMCLSIETSAYMYS